MVQKQQIHSMVLGPAVAPTLLWWGGIPAGRAVRRGSAPLSSSQLLWLESRSFSIHPSYFVSSAAIKSKHFKPQLTFLSSAIAVHFPNLHFLILKDFQG